MYIYIYIYIHIYVQLKDYAIIITYQVSSTQSIVSAQTVFQYC